MTADPTADHGTVRDELTAAINDAWTDWLNLDLDPPETDWQDWSADAVLDWLRDRCGIELDPDADPALIRTHTRANRRR